MTKTSKRIKCVRCDGHGLITSWSFGVHEPDECPDCGGSGQVTLYASGAIAKWHGGPLLAGPSKRREAMAS